MTSEAKMGIDKRCFLTGLGVGAALLKYGALPALAQPVSLTGVKAILFDLFGSVVDWRGSLTRELAAWGEQHNIKADWDRVAIAWYSAYAAMAEDIRTGKRPWTGFEQMLVLSLNQAAANLPAVSGLDADQKTDMALAWRRMTPWPDAIPGLARLKARYLIAPLANASVPAMLFMAKRNGLPWDNVFSGQYLGHYVPDAKSFQGALVQAQLKPGEAMYASAHTSALDAAVLAGLKTAYFPRADETAMRGLPLDRTFLSVHRFDIVVADINDLARQMGA